MALDVELQDIPVDKNVEKATPQPPDNIGAWRNFLYSMKNDPNFKRSVMQVGLGMMRTPQAGQNYWDTASMALEGGVNTLRALRASDKQEARQTEKDKLDDENTRSQIDTRNQQTANDTKKTGLYEQQLIDQSSQAAQKHNLDVQELESLDSYRRGQLRNDATRNANDAAGLGGNKGVEHDKIENLAKEYIQQGMDETQARAKATREVMSTSKNSNVGTMYKDAMNRQLEAWDKDFNNMGKAVPPEIMAKMQERAKQEVMDIAGLQQMTRPGGSPTPGSAPAPGNSSAPGTNKGVVVKPGPNADPAVVQKIQAASARGAGALEINNMLKAQGLNPADYGL